MPKTLQQVVDKWFTNTQGSSNTYKQRIADTQVNPMALAAAQADVAKRNYAAAIDSGRWAEALNSTPVAVWKDAAMTTGAQRLAALGQAAKNKYTKRMQVLLPAIYSLADQVRTMEKGSIQASLARSNAMILGMHALKGRR